MSLHSTWSTMCICSPGVVELVRSNLAPDFPLFHVHKSTFHLKRTQEDGHYRENLSNHELLRVRRVDCHALLKIFGGFVTLYTVCIRNELTSTCFYLFPRIKYTEYSSTHMSFRLLTSTFRQFCILCYSP